MSAYDTRGGLLVQPFAPLGSSSLNTAGQAGPSPLHHRIFKMPSSLTQHAHNSPIEQENRWNPAVASVRTRAALPRAQQVPRQRRDDLNPLRQSEAAKRNQRRDAYLQQHRSRREDAVWHVRADQIQQRDSINEWRRFCEERERDAPSIDDFDIDEGDVDGYHAEQDVPEDVEEQFSQLESHSSQMDSSRYDPLHAKLPSRAIDFSGSFIMSSSVLPTATKSSLQRAYSMDSSTLNFEMDMHRGGQAPPSSPMTRYWSDDEDFEQALWEAFDGDAMDMS